MDSGGKGLRLDGVWSGKAAYTLLCSAAAAAAGKVITYRHEAQHPEQSREHRQGSATFPRPIGANPLYLG